MYLDSMKPYYNICKSASAPMSGRKHSEETKQKLKERIYKKGKDSPSYGKKWSKEQKELWIKIRTGEKRSEEFSKRQSEWNKSVNQIRFLKPFQGLNKRKVKSSDGNIFNSLVECANFYNVKVPTVCDVLKGRSKTLKRQFKLEYYENI